MGGQRNYIYFLGGLLLRDSNTGKWGDHQKKKFFINNSVEAVILFKVEVSGPIETRVSLIYPVDRFFFLFLV